MLRCHSEWPGQLGTTEFDWADNAVIADLENIVRRTEAQSLGQVSCVLSVRFRSSYQRNVNCSIPVLRFDCFMSVLGVMGPIPI